MKNAQTNTKKSSFLEQIRELLNQSIETNTCFAAWRAPLSQTIYIGLGERFSSTQNVFDSQKPIFVFSPFVKAEKHSFFPINSLYEINGNESKSIFENKIEAQSFEIESNTQEATSKADYIKQVEKAIGFINIKAFDKVVVSKVKKVKVEKNAYLTAFQSLIEELDNSFISLVYTPQSGLWLGATPELLLEKEKTQLKTVALAGTQSNTFENIRDAYWRQKEIEEQAYVSRYIINCFKKIRLREFDENGPKTIKAGNLLHLKTEFSINLNEVETPNLPDTLLKLIHPTSAVCGMPLNEALSFIEENETHQRKEFAGYLGPIGINGKSSLYVNLRCAQFIENTAYIYSGAGITEDSIPEKEWEETELKCDTILKRLI